MRMYQNEQDWKEVEASKKMEEAAMAQIGFYNNGSEFYKGNYCILWANDGEEEKIQYIQEAEVKWESDIKYGIKWKDGIKGGEVERLEVILNDENKKLGDIFCTTPYGLIKKNVTGIGATTLELRSQRNSIIVVPTKNLAYNKWETGYNKETGKNVYLYVGSAIGILKNSDSYDIERYINDATITYKKILVVADSLPKVMRLIDPAKWFIMVDEIDMYQTDSSFRPSLEDAIDYYFRFPQKNRCLVSATIRPFFNPQLQEEPLIDINYAVNNPRHLTICCSDNIRANVKEQIPKLLEQYPDDKIAIANNHLTSILKIIALLPEELQQKCSILCGESSKDKAGEYYKELVDNLLPSQITFFTSTYFVGVDIDEPFHLISISDPERLYTLLSPERLKQIAGRCRPGLLSEYVVYSTNARKVRKGYKFVLDRLFEFAKKLVVIANEAGAVLEQYPNFVSEFKIRGVRDSILDASNFSVLESSPLPYIRQNIDGECVLYYFNFDALEEYVRLRNDLYATPTQLLDELSKTCRVTYLEPEERAIDAKQEELERQVDVDLAERESEILDDLIAKLEGFAGGSLEKAAIRQMKRTALREERRFIDRFLELSPYVPFEPLTKTLKNNNVKNDKWFKGYKNAVIFWALDEEHQFKRDLQKAFELNVGYRREECLVKMRKLIKYHIEDNLEYTDSKVMGFLRDICQSFWGKKTDGGATLTITSYVNESLHNEPELIPLARIAPLTKLDGLFKV